ncbi:MAG: hypothetical protein R3D27_15270 [Hyphomicrobiaceae bacterium]
MSAPRIALVHAVTVAIEPVRRAFAERWPDAGLINLLDDSLSPDRARDGDLTPAMSARIGALGDYAQSIGVAGILYTCSAFGPAIDAVAARYPLPVLKPNEAMFDRRYSGGGGPSCSRPSRRVSGRWKLNFVQWHEREDRTPASKRGSCHLR